MKYKAGCKKCQTILIEEVDGFPLGFLWCPKCDEFRDECIKIPASVKIVDFTEKNKKSA